MNRVHGVHCLNLDPVLAVTKLSISVLALYSVRVTRALLGKNRDQIRRLDFSSTEIALRLSMKLFSFLHSSEGFIIESRRLVFTLAQIVSFSVF